VQNSEDKPFTLPTVEVKPEIDDEPWGDDGLTFKQRRFCEVYVSEAAGNGVKAARLAGYSDSNDNVLHATAAENLRKPTIRSYISRLLARHGITPEFLKSRLAQLAQSSMENVCTLDANGKVIVDLEQAAKLGALGQVREISDDGVKIGAVENIKRKVKVHDPTRAIELLLKMQGLLVEKHEHSGTIQHEHRVQQAMGQLKRDPKAYETAMQLAARMDSLESNDVDRN
jgi:hypothetical protein